MFDLFLTQDSGFLSPIIGVLGGILNALYNFLANFGIENAALSIILFTFIINTLMIPLTIKQQKFSKLSSRMQPELTKVTNKYKGKRDEASMRAQQVETQAIYEKYGTNPMAGCLPMLITLPVMFALYRVIYAIPAYVQPINDLYTTIANLTTGNEDAIQYLVDNAKDLQVVTSGWGDNLVSALNNNITYIIDILAKFGRTNWSEFSQFFTGDALTTINTTSAELINVNGFLGGLNIIEAPGFSFPGIIVPILAVATQMIQTKLMTSSTQIDPDNPTAASMKTMNTIMPIVSGGFCLFLPIGVGIYWVAGSVFRIVQQILVNHYLDNSTAVDAMIEKNVEKMKAKREKMGLQSADGTLKSVATTRTSTIKEKASVSGTTTKGNKNNKKNQDSSNYKRGEVSYEKGSIASIANMLGSSRDDKGE